VNDQELADLFERAAAITSKVPESMHNSAFPEALRALGVNRDVGSRAGFDDVVPPDKRQRPPKPRSATAVSDKSDNRIDVMLHMNRSEASQVDNETDAMGKVLAILEIAHRDFGMDGLTVSELHTILTTKFRYKISPRGVRHALDRGGPMVDLFPQGKLTYFRMMDAGEAYLRTPVDQRDTATPLAVRKTKKAKKKPVSTTSSTSRTSGSTNKTNGSARRVTSSPSSAIQDLITDGWLSTPRTISAIRDHLEHKRGRKYGVNELSTPLVRMLRNNVLDREKNGEGQYEYVVAKP